MQRGSGRDPCCGHDVTFGCEYDEKLGRAHGGCLGTKRRRRTWQTAISNGELYASIDPLISEWGNPAV
jgi:hypothetical protein